AVCCVAGATPHPTVLQRLPGAAASLCIGSNLKMGDVMSFDLKTWLKSQIGDYEPDIPLLDVSAKNAADEREWLVTNGLGSYASASIWGANTRRYHGLFVAALEPPVRRHVLLSRIDEVVDGQPLSTNHWTSGAVTPEGYKLLEAFTVYPVPT